MKFWRRLRSRFKPVVEPRSRVFGLDLGTAIDRHYIEGFLAEHASAIRGDVLEVADNSYTQRFGGAGVVRSHVLHATSGAPGATITGDLGTGVGVPREAFDCIILTQTLQLIYDLPRAVETCHDALVPGGTLLATVPGISQISRYDMDRWGEFWRFTSLSAKRLFAERFGGDFVTVQAHGNVRVASAFLQGTPLEEMRARDLAHRDPDYEVIITIRAVKRASR